MTQLWSVAWISAPTPETSSPITKLVYLEYKRACVLDALTWAQSPICPELLCFQPGVLNDKSAPQVRTYVQAVRALVTLIKVRNLPIARVVYIDFVSEINVPSEPDPVELDIAFQDRRKLPEPEMKRLRKRWDSAAWRQWATQYTATCKAEPT